MKLLVILSILLINVFHLSESAKILGVFPYPSKSHSILGQALFTELANRGHDVTYVSPYPLKTPLSKNYHDIGITSQGLFDTFQEELDASFEDTSENMIMLLKFWFDNIARMQEYTLSDPAVQMLLNSNKTFDLCVIEFLMNESVLGFGAHFNCKIIAMSTIGQVKYINDMIHSPMPLSITPHPFLKFTDQMSYWERMQNMFSHVFEDIGYHFYHYPLQAKIYDKYFKSDKPSFDYMLKHSVSMVFLNTHFSLNYPQAYLPNMIEIGGFHVKNDSKSLPDDIKSFIESAEHGVVYFSLGGNLKPSKMKDEKKKAIFEALSKLKQKVIWKWDEPLNVDSEKFLIRKWLPQDDILAHENVKVFVTHGGLLSCTESILRGTPIVGIPIFGDQMMNMARAELLGWGVQVTYPNLTESSLSWALSEVLGNSKYAANTLEIKNRLLDQPQPPMERAIYWVEYVLRHKGAHYMQTSAQYLSAIQYHNLDIYATFALIALPFLFVFSFILRNIYKCINVQRKSSRDGKLNKKKKKNI